MTEVKVYKFGMEDWVVVLIMMLILNLTLWYVTIYECFIPVYSWYIYVIIEVLAFFFFLIVSIFVIVSGDNFAMSGSL